MEGFLQKIIELGFENSIALGISLLLNIALGAALFYIARHVARRPDVENQRLQQLMQRATENTKASLQKLVAANLETVNANKESYARELAINTAHFSDLLRQREADVERFFSLVKESQDKYAQLVAAVQAEESGSMELVASLLKSLQQITDSIAALFGTTKSDHERLFNYLELHLGNLSGQVKELSQDVKELTRTRTRHAHD